VSNNLSVNLNNKMDTQTREKTIAIRSDWSLATDAHFDWVISAIPVMRLSRSEIIFFSGSMLAVGGVGLSTGAFGLRKITSASKINSADSFDTHSYSRALVLGPEATIIPMASSSVGIHGLLGRP